MPKDPGDFLVDFLLKKADEIDQQQVRERELALKAKLDAKNNKH